jgi:hypothetical protein
VGKNEIKPRKRRRSRRAGHDVSALVKRFLTELAAGESDAEHLKREGEVCAVLFAPRTVCRMTMCTLRARQVAML